MISPEKFDFIKKKYGLHASWAIWAEEGTTPTSNIGDMSILDPKINKNLLSELNQDIVLVALNFSIDVKHEPWENFHTSRTHGTDFKIRYALRGTKLCGAYMTDILKDYPEMDSHKVRAHLKKHPELEQKNIEFFRQELKDIGAENPRIIAFGNVVFDILKRNLENRFQINKIPHYAHYMSKEEYREKVKTILDIKRTT